MGLRGVKPVGKVSFEGRVPFNPVAGEGIEGRGCGKGAGDPVGAATPGITPGFPAVAVPLLKGFEEVGAAMGTGAAAAGSVVGMAGRPAGALVFNTGRLTIGRLWIGADDADGTMLVRFAGIGTATSAG